MVYIYSKRAKARYPTFVTIIFPTIIYFFILFAKFM